MCDGVQEAVLLFVAAYFADKKDGIERDADREQPKDGNADGQRNPLAPVENDPANIERDGEADQADTEGDEEKHRLLASRDAHGERVAEKGEKRKELEELEKLRKLKSKRS